MADTSSVKVKCHSDGVIQEKRLFSESSAITRVYLKCDSKRNEQQMNKNKSHLYFMVGGSIKKHF